MPGPMLDARLVLVLAVLLMSLFAWLGVRHARGRVETAEDYLVARDTQRVGAMTATLVASVMGGWILFSPAEAGARSGITAVIGYGVGSMVAMLVYIFLAPRIRRVIPRGHTLSEFAHARYGTPVFVLVFLVSLFYMFLFLATNMTAITGALALLAGVPVWITAVLVGGIVLAYTAYGGLKASIYTDRLQLILILPLLIIGYLAAMHWLGGVEHVYAATLATQPQLLDAGLLPGILFGATLIIAILGAELLNQAWWQRTYAARNERVLRRSFLVAGLMVFPMVVLSGLFGVAAAGLGLIPQGGESVALFHLLLAAVPDWIVLIIVLLALLLVMSTSDTLLSAIASLVTADLPRLRPGARPRSLTNIARGVTVVAAAGATLIAAQGWSVLAIFLTADLFAVAVAFPLLYGLWSKRTPGWGVMTASIAAILVGIAYFPELRPVLDLIPYLSSMLPAVNSFLAFAGAASVSVAITLAAERLGKPFDLGRLAKEILPLGERRSVPVAQEEEP